MKRKKPATATIAFESEDEKKRCKDRAKDLYGNYGFSLYVRLLMNEDLSKAEKRKAS